MDNNGKISTSIQYQLTNVKLFNEVFANWENFNSRLSAGPEEMKKYLVELWNTVKDKLKDNEKLELKDINKVVTEADFNVTVNKTNNGTNVFFISFPDYEYTDGACKYVALALTPNMPKYFTLEYSKHAMENTPCWVVGEWVIENSNSEHKNYGAVDNMRIEWFAGFIINKLNSENL